VRALMIVPMLVAIEPALNAGARQAAENKPPPEFECSKGAFDLAVEIGGADASLDVVNLHRGQGRMKTAAELSAVVGDDEARLARFPCGFVDE
jgi:hypothetical protein